VQREHFIYAILDAICRAEVRIWVRHGCPEWKWIHHIQYFSERK
jgi:hypothetical protein